MKRPVRCGAMPQHLLVGVAKPRPAHAVRDSRHLDRVSRVLAASGGSTDLRRARMCRLRRGSPDRQNARFADTHASCALGALIATTRTMNHFEGYCRRLATSSPGLGAVARRVLVTALAATLGVTACSDSAELSDSNEEELSKGTRALSFKLEADHGRLVNHFYSKGEVATHLITTSGDTPRILAAFPAGNSGAAVFFEKQQSPVTVQLEGDLRPIYRGGLPKRAANRSGKSDGSFVRNFFGVSGTIRIKAPKIRTERGVLGSIRSIRDYIALRKVPSDVVSVLESSPRIAYEHTSVDRTHHVEFALEPLEGTKIEIVGDEQVELTSGGKGSLAGGHCKDIVFKMTVLSDEVPLAPLERDEILRSPEDPSAKDDLNSLAFLSYKEKLLAGSWRFLTYFGRDTLMSVRLLMDNLKPEVIEAALGAVLQRIGADGRVAHEENIGEFAMLEHRKKHPNWTKEQWNTPEFEYFMVDDDVMLAPILAHYLLDTPAGKANAAAFLQRKLERPFSASETTFHAALARNLNDVLKMTEPFARDPQWQHLIKIEPQVPVGNWRDSMHGLGDGRYPWDVNVSLVPAALAAASRLYASSHTQDTVRAARAKTQGEAWAAASKLFDVPPIPVETAQAQVLAYAHEEHLPDATAAKHSITHPLSFPAISLDAAGHQIAVMHSDDGFRLLFNDPDDDELVRMAERILMPFPAGLRTPVGVVVASPTFEPDPKIRKLFTRAAYHGTVVWSWQQALLAAGLNRQIDRAGPAAKAKLIAAEKALWAVIDASKSKRTSELWTFDPSHGRYDIADFGLEDGAADESNAAQLWSNVYLAVKPPPARQP